MTIRTSSIESAPRVADAAAKVQENFPVLGSPGYEYAAGVEDALRWILGEVSNSVFASHPETRHLTHIAQRFGDATCSDCS